MSGLEVVVALVIAVGIAGVVVPVLPGSALVVGAIRLWAARTGTARGWVGFSVATALVMVGAVVKYVVPGRRLQDAGIPTSTMLLGGLLGVIGFFVIPVVGLVLGFVVGCYLAELGRVGRQAAWPATKHALMAAGLSLLIELTASMLAAAVWVTGVVLT